MEQSVINLKLDSLFQIVEDLKLLGDKELKNYFVEFAKSLNETQRVLAPELLQNRILKVENLTKLTERLNKASKIIDSSNFINVLQIEKRYGYNRKFVNEWIESGSLISEPTFSNQLFSIEDVERYVNSLSKEYETKHRKK